MGARLPHPTTPSALLLASAIALSPATGSAQSDCEPLPPPAGAVVDGAAGDVAGLVAAVAAATTGGTVRLADGTYDLREALVFATPGVTLRSASGNRAAVVVDGGYTPGDGYHTDFLVKIQASAVTVADLTLRYATYHPIQIYGPGTPIAGILIHNVALVDPGEQAIKINPVGSGWIDDGTVECSTIELTELGRSQVRDCYTGGIDAHAAQGWTVRNNRITGFWCELGLSEHAIHFWRGSRDTVVEGNVVVDCARGIGFGLGTDPGPRSYPDDPYPGLVVGHYDGIVRNNFVAAAAPALFAAEYGFDSGIGLEQARGAVVLHNTVASSQAPASSSIEWRFANTLVHLANNLVSGWTSARDGAIALEEATIAAPPPPWCAAGATADRHHPPRAPPPADAGGHLAGACPTDLDGDGRDALPDVGADELSTAIFNDGFDAGTTAAWDATSG